MLEFFPKELRDGLFSAQLARARKKSRLKIQVGDQSYPLLRFWHDGLSLEASHAQHLRGHVDIYDGARHVYQCLIIASEVEGEELICGFKRATAVLDRAALDYVRDENAPVAFLPKS